MLDRDRAQRNFLFCEEFASDRNSYFDAELNEAVSSYALARRELHGYCNLASAATTFAVSDPNLREGVTASVSGSRARQRLMVCGMSLALFDVADVGLDLIARTINDRRSTLLLAESNTPLSAALSKAVDPLLLTLSEFFSDEYRSGQLVKGIRNEDLRATSFADDSLDWVLTSDVFEHIPDPEAAEREVVRILKPGGIYCFTVPLHPRSDTDIVLARPRPDGTTEYLAPPTYHGDPLRPEGVLVYRVFSVPAMSRRFAQLGATCRTYRLWSKYYGLLGPGCFVHVVKKHA